MPRRREGFGESATATVGSRPFGQEVVARKPSGLATKQAQQASKQASFCECIHPSGQPGDNIDVTLNTDTMMVSAETVE